MIKTSVSSPTAPPRTTTAIASAPMVLPARLDVPIEAPAMPGMQWSSVQLGPELPMPVFTSQEVWNAERIGALAIYCSDGRWGEAFDEFCHKHLHIPRYDRMAVAGGPAWLADHADDADESYEALRQQLRFLVKVHELERIVLISHHGCAVYRERFHLEADQCLPRQTEDLRCAAEILRRWFPDVRTETYLAMRRGSCFTFHWLNA
jgi:hypothetical protein